MTAVGHQVASDSSRRLNSGSVLITGMAGRIGRQLVRRLHRKRRVVAMGPQTPGDLPSDVERVPLDPLRSASRAVFARPDIGAIVHLGVFHSPNESRSEMHSHNLLAFQRVIESAVRYGIPKVVLLSSAKVYGPRPENAQYLSEQAPLLAGASFTEMHIQVELDMYAQSCFWRSPEIELVILRPSNVLGTLKNAASNYLRLPVVTTLMGFDPMVQPIHQDDLVSAIELALSPGIRGVFNVAGPPPVSLSVALRMLKRRTVSLPVSVARSGLSGLFRLGMSSFPAPELDFLRYVCMVDDGAARSTLGYHPSFDLQATLDSVDGERWLR